MAQLHSLRTFLGVTTGWIRRLPSSLVGSLAATSVVSAALLAIVVVVTLVLLAGTTMFAGLYSAPSTAVLAFQPYAHGETPVDVEEAAQARRDILSDRQNPLRCVASAHMKSAALPVMAMPESDQPLTAMTPDIVSIEPTQITDDTAALLPEIETVIATTPRGAAFFEAYAFVVTAINGGVDSWQRFVSVSTQLRLGTPVDKDTAMSTASVFFAPTSDLAPTQALAAAVMMRLSASRIIDGEREAGLLLEHAVNGCV